MSSTCRELVAQVKSLCFLVENKETMELVNKKLSEIIDLMEKSSPQENGIILEKVKIKCQNEKEKEKRKCAFTFPKLPEKKTS